MNGARLPPALPGQFLVLRLRPAANMPILLRSYSLSSEPSARSYRITVKREPHGVAGAYIDETVKIGDVLDVSAPRGNFTLRQDAAPVVLTLTTGMPMSPGSHGSTGTHGCILR